MPNKKLENFNFSTSIDSNSELSCFSHKIAIYEKKRTKSSWYMKFLGTEINSAISEVIAQELFRLILPDHPKTRCVEEIVPTDNRVYYYVASKEIKNINPFYFVNEKNYCQDITSGKVKGLGAVQVISLWLNEIDFKAGNVVINEEDKVIKLDGGQCFASILEHIPSYGERMFDITSGDLESLPALTDYTPYNWLDFITHDQEETTHEKIINPYSRLLTIKNNDGFKNEVNQAILRIISLPDEFIYYFVKSYVSNKNISTQLINNIKERKQQLEKSALEMKNFTAYLSSPEALKEIGKYINYLKTFKTMSKFFLFNELKNNHKIDIDKIVYEKFLIAKGTSVLNELSGDLRSFNSDSYVKNKVEKIDYIIKKLVCICEKHLDFTKQIQNFESDLNNISFGKDSFLFSMNKLINRLNSLKGAPLPPSRNLPSFFPKIKARKKLITREEMLGTESNQVPLGYNCLHT